MNNAKMWLVVSPSVGVPIFLGAVAVGSFAVHVAVLSNTSWVSDFLSGQPLGSGDMEEASAASILGTEENKARVSYVIPAADGSQEVFIVLPDGTTTSATLHASDVIAASATAPKIATH
ncbi:MAG: light-harvesting protein [Pseudomonadota bacterium]